MKKKGQRLIDANELSEKIGDMKFDITRNRGGYQYCNEEEKSEWDKLDFFDTLVCEASTVDAVEVVRCKDCASYGTDGCADGFGWCALHDRGKMDFDFCSCGGRRGYNEVD